MASKKKARIIKALNKLSKHFKGMIRQREIPSYTV